MTSAKRSFHFSSVLMRSFLKKRSNLRSILLTFASLSPAHQEMPFVPGGVVHFSKDICAQCRLKAQCTTSPKGRSVSIHPDEALLIELRQRQLTPEGRTRLRE